MGGLRVAPRTLSVECCLLLDGDPRPHWHQSPYRRYCGQQYIRAGRRPGAQKWVPWQRRAAGRGRRLVSKVFSQDSFCCVLWSTSSRTSHGGGLQGLLPGQGGGSTALRGAEPRFVGLAAPFSDVTKLVLFSLGNLNIFFEHHCIWQSLAFVFCVSQRQFLDDFPAFFP